MPQIEGGGALKPIVARISLLVLSALAFACGLHAQETAATQAGQPTFRLPGERFGELKQALTQSLKVMGHVTSQTAAQVFREDLAQTGTYLRQTGPDPAWLATGARSAADRLAGLPESKTAWKASLAAVIAASVIDAQSSWGKQEANPLLANSAGRFGGRSVAIKGILTGAALGTQWFMVRHKPEMRRYATLGNFGLAGIYAKVAAHNYENGR